MLTLRGLVTYYVLFFIHLESRRVDIAGITIHPDERWTQQMAHVTMEGCGATRQEVRTLVPNDHRVRSNRSCCLPKSQLECLFGALGQVGRERAASIFVGFIICWYHWRNAPLAS
jgi:hypothetical protein